jgi:hypothetical protein
MVKESNDSIEFIYCYCGCGFTRSKYDNQGREYRFIKGHSFKGKKHLDDAIKKNRDAHIGKKHTEGSRKKISEALKGERHPLYGKHHSAETRNKIGYAQKGKNNHNFGKPRSEETKRKIGDAQIGEKHRLWKGDDVGYFALHEWIRMHLPKRDLCELCKLVPPKEVACITNVYNRKFKNWARFCIKCHRQWDNIYERAKIRKRLNKLP